MKRSCEESDVKSNKKQKLSSKMEQIANNPGLKHIIENVFLNLDFKDLVACQLVTKSFNQILDGPIFWLKKWRTKRGLSEKNNADWAKAIQITQGTNLEKNVPLYIKRVIMTGHFVDIPCYIDSDVVEKSTEFTFEEALKKLMDEWFEKDRSIPNSFLYDKALKEKFPGILQILAPFTENPNKHPQIENGFLTPIHIAARHGCTEVIKILAPILLLENANEPDKTGWTPIHYAANNGHREIIEFLTPLTKNPNVPTTFPGYTPIHFASLKGHAEIIKYLIPFTENPNEPNKYGVTPFNLATKNGHDEIVRILEKHMKH